MAHIGKPIIRKKTISAQLSFSPKSLTKNDKSFESVSPQLIVKNDSLVFAYLCKVYVSNHLKRNCTNYIFGDYSDRNAAFPNVSDDCPIVMDIIHIDDFRIKLYDILNVGF